jgi:hypothetical protein
VRAELLEDAGKGKNLDARRRFKLEKLRLELVTNFNQPAHNTIML